MGWAGIWIPESRRTRKDESPLGGSAAGRPRTHPAAIQIFRVTNRVGLFILYERSKKLVVRL